MIRRRIGVPGLVLALSFAGSLAAGAAAAEVRRALVIGNGSYEKPLVTSRADAKAIADKLKRLGFKEDDVIHVDDKPLGVMKEALEKFAAKASGADVLLFYFAGHGMQVNNRNYLLPTGDLPKEIAKIPDASLPLDEVFNAFRKAPAARVKIVVLDACRDNPLAPPNPLGGETWVPGLAKPTNAPPGTISFFATDPGKTAQDGRTDHSYFTASLLYNMTEPGLELRDLFTAVRTWVREATSRRQTPWEDGSPLQEFYFQAPATLTGEILGGDDEVLVLVNGVEQISWNSNNNQNKPRKIFLKPGENQLVVKVYNQNTYRGGCSWFRDFFVQFDSELSLLGLDPPNPPEGWNFHVRFRGGPDSPGSFLDLSGAEDPPHEDRHGEMFTVARATILVNRENGQITFPEVDREAWKH